MSGRIAGSVHGALACIPNDFYLCSGVGPVSYKYDL